MAKYTIELRHVAEGHELFPFYYPFYDEKKRPQFENAFLKHFYFREIGAETIDKFLFFLEEKMNTVFPYYNELFKTAQLEYSILDNYNIIEKTTMKRENEGHSRGETYAVGQTFDEQKTTTSEKDTSENTRNGVSDSEHSETVGTESTNNQTVTSNGNKTTNETENANQTDVKKFLDTPQGAVNLDDNKYVTTLNHDTADRENSRDGTTTENKTDTAEGGATSDTETEGASKTTENVTENGTVNRDATGTLSGSQKSTNDGTIKSHSKGEIKETMEFTRKGNIGIDTDADMIQKHIKLQQILKKIELMFFDECEDLFMLIY